MHLAPRWSPSSGGARRRSLSSERPDPAVPCTSQQKCSVALGSGRTSELARGDKLRQSFREQPDARSRAGHSGSPLRPRPLRPRELPRASASSSSSVPDFPARITGSRAAFAAEGAQRDVDDAFAAAAEGGAAYGQGYGGADARYGSARTTGLRRVASEGLLDPGVRSASDASMVSSVNFSRLQRENETLRHKLLLEQERGREPGKEPGTEPGRELGRGPGMQRGRAGQRARECARMCGDQRSDARHPLEQKERCDEAPDDDRFASPRTRHRSRHHLSALSKGERLLLEHSQKASAFFSSTLKR